MYASGDSSISYALEGDNNTDFSVDETGRIKVAKTLNYDQNQKYDLSLVIKGRYDTVSVPLSIEVSKNIAPDFSVNCSNSCSVAENSSQGSTIIRANRTDNDSDSVSYQLQNTFSEKFEINDKTGEVKLKNTLDYEL